MKVISLYSFKGGVGRSSLVLNLAYELAARAKFVVVADWDLHAPGLSLMDDLAMPDGPFPRKGLLDFLHSAMPTASDKPLEIIDPKVLAQPTELARRARHLSPKFGDLYFVPAGRFSANATSDYPEALRRLHLPDFLTWRARFPNTEIEQPVLRFFRERIAAVRSDIFGPAHPPDFLLLDSRTGITEIGDLLLGQYVDHYVVLFGLNEQNQTGMEVIVREAQQRVSPGGIADALTLVASPVPVGEEDLLRDRLLTLNDRITKLARPLEDGSRIESMPAILKIPYHPRLALREEIIVEKYPDSTLAQHYRDVASHILREHRSIEQVQANTRVRVLADVPPPAYENDEPPLSMRFAHDEPAITKRAPSAFLPPPSWNWPKPTMRIERLLPGVPIELADALLYGAAWSDSLGVRDKVRVLAFASRLPVPRIARLIEPFVDEKDGWSMSWDQDWQRIEGSHAAAAVAWVRVLHLLKELDASELWSALAVDRSGTVIAREFATDRFLYLVGIELVDAADFPSAAAILERAFSSSALDVIRMRLQPLLDALRNAPNSSSAQRGSFEQERSAEKKVATVSAPIRAAIRAVFEIVVGNPETVLDAVTALRNAGWADEARTTAASLSQYYDVLTYDMWLNLAWEHFILDDYSPAELCIRKVLSINSQEGTNWALLGSIIAREPSKRHEARSALVRALSLTNDAFDIRMIARAYAEDLNEFDTAFRIYERVLNLEEPDLENELEFAEIAIEARQHEIATQALERARILSEGPVQLRHARFDSRRSIIAIRFILALAIVLRERNYGGVPSTVMELHDSVMRHGTYDWRFDGLFASLSVLPSNDFDLIRQCALFLRGETKSPELLRALEAWTSAHLS